MPSLKLDFAEGLRTTLEVLLAELAGTFAIISELTCLDFQVSRVHLLLEVKLRRLSEEPSQEAGQLSSLTGQPFKA